MGVTRTAISLANTPESTAQALLAVALNPDRTKMALAELSASKADHDKSRDAANAAKQIVADAQRTVDAATSANAAKEADLVSREAALAQSNADVEAYVASANVSQRQEASRLQEWATRLQTKEDDLVSRETALVPREEALDSREADLKRQKKEASDWLNENRAALDAARKLLAS